MKTLLACLFSVLLPLYAFQANPAAEKSQEEKKGSIEGRVVNGVTGEAVRKATLILTGTNSGRQTRHHGNGRRGFFRIQGAGRWQVSVESLDAPGSLRRRMVGVDPRVPGRPCRFRRARR